MLRKIIVLIYVFVLISTCAAYAQKIGGKDKSVSFEGTIEAFASEAGGLFGSSNLSMGGLIIMLKEYQHIDFIINPKLVKKYDLRKAQKVVLKCKQGKSPIPDRERYRVIGCEISD